MENRTLHAALAPWADGVKVSGRTPFVTPWRTIQLADRAGRPRTLGDRPESQSAERYREHELDQADEVRRDLVGDAHQHDDVVVRAEAWCDDRERQTLHRFRGGQRPGRRARGRMEHRMGRRLDSESERVLVHQSVSRLRPRGSRAIRALEGNSSHRSQRDVGWHRELRAADGQRVRALSLARARTRSRPAM